MKRFVPVLRCSGFTSAQQHVRALLLTMQPLCPLTAVTGVVLVVGFILSIGFILFEFYPSKKCKCRVLSHAVKKVQQYRCGVISFCRTSASLGSFINTEVESDNKACGDYRSGKGPKLLLLFSFLIKLRFLLPTGFLASLVDVIFLVFMHIFPNSSCHLAITVCHGIRFKWVFIMMLFSYLWKETGMHLFVLFLYVLETRFFLAFPSRSLGRYHEGNTMSTKKI